MGLSLSGKTFEKKKKKGLNPQMDSAQIVIFVFVTIIIDNMGKVILFFGQPVYGQLIKCLNKDKIVEMSRKIVAIAAMPSRSRFGSR